MWFGSTPTVSICFGSSVAQQARVAQLPHFVFSPNALLSVIGLMRGPEPAPPTPHRDWREATVDVVIPAFNEKHTSWSRLRHAADAQPRESSSRRWQR
jgi:hypothetical protein